MRTPIQEKEYKRYAVLKIDEVLPFVVQRTSDNKLPLKEFGKFSVKMSSDRYHLFKNKGVICVECGIEGKFFALEKTRNGNETRPHFNLYAVDDEGVEILMTKDHILPKSKGGKNNQGNYQTMCTVCNYNKGSTT